MIEEKGGKARLARAALVVFFAAAANVFAGTVTVNFDAVNTAASPYYSDATSYLAGYGITVSNLTAGTSLIVGSDQFYYGGAAVRAVSTPNTFTQSGLNGPISYTLNFSTPLTSFSFKRSSLWSDVSGITHPQWSATAYDSLSNQIGSPVGESAMGWASCFCVIPAASFTLNGPGIAKITFSASNVSTAFSAAILDDFVLTTLSAPSITSFSPASGAIGSSVAINGTAFTGATSVTINGVSATYSVISDTQITASVPATSGSGPIAVTTPGGTATSSSSFTVSGSTITSVATGAWDSSSTWNPAVVPGATDNVIIGANTTVTAGASDAAATLVINTATTGSTGVNINAGQSLAVSGNVSIAQQPNNYAGLVQISGGAFTAGSISLTGAPAGGSCSGVVLGTGTLTVNGSFAFAGSSFNACVYLNSSGTATFYGDFPSGAIFIAGSTSTVNMNGTAQQTIGGNYSFANLNINNGSGVFIPGVATVNGTLSLTNGVVTANSGLVVANSGSVSRTAGWVNGPMEQTFVTLGTRTFDVGTATAYMPVTMTTTGGTAPYSATIIAKPGPYPLATGPHLLQNYWNVTVHAPFTANVTFGYPPSTVVGNENNYRLGGYWSPGGWFYPSSTVDTVNHQVTGTGLTNTAGDYTAGEMASIGTPPPTIGSFSPSSGTVGTSVLLTGTNFTGTTGVAFNGTAATFTVNSSSQITTTVPTGATTGPITVTSPGGVATSTTNFVIPIPTTTTVVSSPNPSVAGQSVTFTAQINQLSATGTASFYDGATLMGTATVSSGSAALSSSALTIGSHSITASYSGDANYAASTSSPYTHIVNCPTPTATINAPSNACANSSANASVTTNASGATYAWTIANGTITGGGNAATVTFTAGASGNVTLSVTVTASCGTSATSSVTLPITTQPTITASGPTTFCQGGSVTLTASSGTSYSWSNGATTQSINVTTSGNYTVTVTGSGGCSGTSAPVPVTVNAAPVASVTASGPTAFCQGGSVTLTATNGQSWLWSNGATTQSINVTTSGSYSVAVTGATGCSATSTPTTVTVNPLPPTTITAPMSLCANSSSSASVPATAGATYTWSITNGTITGGQGTSNITFSVGTQSPVALAISATNAGCSSSGSASINIGAFTPTISASGPTTFCQGGSVTLTASSGTAYSWSNGATTQSITVSSSGSYSVTVTGAGGCSGTSAPVSVTVNAPPVASVTASGPTTFCQGGSVTLTATNGASWLWSNGATTQSITVNASGNYSVTVSGSGGCSGTSVPTSVTVIPAPTLTYTLPPSVTAGSAGNSASVTTTTAGITYAWSITNGTITAGANTSSVTFTAGASGVVTLQLTVTNGGCTVVDTKTIPIASGADLNVTIAASSNPVPPSSTITYAVVVANAGPTDAQSISAAVLLDGALTFLAVNAPGWSCSVVGRNVTCTVATLPVGSNAAFSLTATTPATGSLLSTTATVSSATPDPDMADNTATATTSIHASTACPTASPSLTAPAPGADVINPVSLSWTAVANVTAYDVWIASGPASAALIATTTATSATVTLPAGNATWYVVGRAAAECPVAISPKSTFTVAAANTCDHTAPSLVAPASSATVTSPVTFSWTAVTGATGYVVSVSIDGAAPQDVGATDANTTAIANVKLTGNNVAWFVQANFAGCPATQSSTFGFTLTKPDPCANRGVASLIAPQDGSAASSSTIELHWSTVPAATGYRVWISVDGEPFHVAGSTAADTTLHLTIAKGTVEWYVESLFTGCASTESAHAKFTVPAAVTCASTAATPVAPASGSTVQQQTVEFSWSAAPNSIGYEVYLALSGGTPALIGTTSAATKLVHDVPAGNLEWYVRALFNGCPSIDSAQLPFTFTPPPACPTQRPILIAPDDGALITPPLSFRWAPVAGVSQYQLLYSVNGGSVVSVTTTDTHVDGIFLDPGVVQWSVQEVVSSCPGLQSSFGRFSAVPPPPPCTTPATPELRAPATASSNVDYTIRWTPDPNAAFYELQESEGGDFSNAATSAITANERAFTHDIGNAAAQKTFWYRVRGVSNCNGNRGLYSNPSVVAILNPAGTVGASPADNRQRTVYHLQICTASGPNCAFVSPAGQKFSATTDQPWLTVVPSTGTVGAAGTTLTVTADTTGLTIGTSTGGVIVSFSAPSAQSASRPLDGSGGSTTNVSIDIATSSTTKNKSTPPPDALIIPAVAHADGMQSHFDSDVRITNTAPDVIKYQLTFTPTGDAGVGATKQANIDIDPGQTVALDDVLRSWFGAGPADAGTAGWLEIRPLTTPSSASAGVGAVSNLLTFASSKTYSTSSNGSFGSYVAAIPYANFASGGPDVAKAVPLTLQHVAQSSAYRTNIGLVEGSGDPAEVLLTVFGGDGKKLTEFTQALHGGEHVQLNSLLARKNITVDNGRVEVRVTSATGKVVAYASVVDNTTNDAQVVSAVPLNQSGSTTYVLPGVVDGSTAAGHVRSDVRLFNPSSSAVTATLALHTDGGSDPAPKQITLAPNQVTEFDDAVNSLFGISNVTAALHVTFTQPSLVVGTARTYASQGTGTVGEFISAVTPPQTVSAGARSLQLLQVEESNRFSTDVGVAEISGNPADIELSVIPSDSKVIAKTQVSLKGGEFRAFKQLLKSIGIPTAYSARVTVRVVGGAGRVTAYASVTDQRTGDPIFIPAQ